MSKIQVYPQDLMPDNADKVIGTRASDGKTLNYTLIRLANYLSMNGYADPSRASITLKFDVLEGADTQPEFGSAVIVGNAVETIGLRDITSIRVSYKNNNNTNFRKLLEYFEGGDIKIQSTQGTSEHAYAIYSLNSVSDVNDLYADLSLTLVSGEENNNTISNGDYISISSLSTDGTNVHPNQLRHGAGVPANSLGNDGDFYLDTETYILYGPKSSGSWSGTGQELIGADGAHGVHGTDNDISFDGTNITITTTTYNENNSPTISTEGPINLKGDTGEKGSKGSTIINGTGTPDSNEGRDGDYYIDNSTQTLYVKAGGTWSSLFVIKGDSGQAGQQGQRGEQGVQGAYDLEIFRPSALPLSGAPTGGSFSGITLTPPTGWYANYSTALAAADDGDTLFEARAGYDPLVDTLPFSPTWGLAFPAGAQGATGEPGQTGPQGPGYSNVTLTNNGDTLNFIGQDTPNVSVTGVKGDDGASGRGITSVTLVSTVDGLKTYRVDFTDGLSPFTFTTQDGTNGTDGATWHGVLDRAPNTNEYGEGDFTVSNIGGVSYIYGPQMPDGTYDAPEQITGKSAEFNQDVNVTTGVPGAGAHASIDLNTDDSDNTKNVYDLSLTFPHVEGQPGPQGIFTRSVFIASISEPARPSSTQYDLDNPLSLTYVPTFWSAIPVELDDNQLLWESRAVINPALDTEDTGFATANWGTVFEAGEAGPAGSNGEDGESAYQLYVDQQEALGNTPLSENDWLDSFQGEQGPEGRFTIFIYSESASHPGTITGGTYNVETGVLDISGTTPGAWSETPPASPTETVYEARATVNIATDTIVNDLVTLTWTTPFEAGAQGAPGAPGAPGAGLDVGGTTGQIAVKASATNYDTDWVGFETGALGNIPVFFVSNGSTITATADVSGYTPLSPSTHGGDNPGSDHMYTRTYAGPTRPTNFDLDTGWTDTEVAAHHQQNVNFSWTDPGDGGQRWAAFAFPTSLLSSGKPTVHLGGQGVLRPEDLTELVNDNTTTYTYRAFTFDLNEAISIQIDV